MSGAVVQDDEWDKLEHSGRFSSVMSYPFWKKMEHAVNTRLLKMEDREVQTESGLIQHF